ncbi:hypothetical protein Q8F55_008559 [Vanrija albida]|uniref:Uncharacterized protein n=1 Tax=Vanrija albida TaxID=181172 RepID=A0ABR3PS51_9TREE
MFPSSSQYKWYGPTHLAYAAREINAWPVAAFIAPVNEVKAYLNKHFQPDSYARHLKITMDPYCSIMTMKGHLPLDRAIPCKDTCPLLRHLTALYTGPGFTPSQHAAWKEMMACRIAAQQAKAAKAAARNKAKRKAHKERKKAAAGADGESEWASTCAESESTCADERAVDGWAGAPLPVPNPTATHVSAIPKFNLKPHPKPKAKPTKESWEAAYRATVGDSRQPVPTAPNLFCPLCSPATALICSHKHFGTDGEPGHNHSHGH